MGERSKKADASAAREARLKMALKANMGRRKAAQRSGALPQCDEDDTKQGLEQSGQDDPFSTTGPKAGHEESRQDG